MAESVIKKQMTIIQKTVTGTTDSNGYLATDLLSNEYAVLSVSEITIDGTAYLPFYANVMQRGGTPGQYISIQFSTWAHDIIAKNKTVSATINYVKL